VVVLPLLSLALWYITASSSCIGERYRNRWWENLLMCVLVLLAIWSAYLMLVGLVRWS
jgi:hypothetical protein